jgi:predicted nuclease of restriction endonuclease-like (RecB) superfamily
MPTKRSKALVRAKRTVPTYDHVLIGMVELLEQARHAAARAVNAVMTATYWEIGRRIVELEQGGRRKADYGEQLIDRLAEDLTARFGRSFGRSNLFQMRSFYLAYFDLLKTHSQASQPFAKKIQTLSGQFPLSWSHYVRLMSVREPEARAFYEAEALRGGWSIRQLDRQISSMFYPRTLLSRNKAAMLVKGAKPGLEDAITSADEIRDPFVLEFLNLKDEYSERDLEEALIRHLETFLLELGGDFAFVARQRRLRIGDQWFRVDLIFFHRRLRCLVIIDLKLGKFTHADAGQMHMYLNYAGEHWTNPGENPPVGLILCDEKSAAVVHYTLENLPNKVLAAEYKTVLPDERLLREELQRTRRALETRTRQPTKKARRE